MNRAIALMGEGGLAVLFAIILVDQLGLPLPILPVLLVAGALVGAGKLALAPALAVVVVACALGGFAWYEIGRWRGHHALAVLCRLSLEPDSCVRKSGEIFGRHRDRAVVLGRFLPGVDAMVPALAGIAGMGRLRFVALSSVGASVWASSYGAIGYAFSDRLEDVARRLDAAGAPFAWLAAAAVAGYVAWKYVERQRFLRSLRADRVAAEEVKRRLDAGEDVLVVDLRSDLDHATDPHMILGAIRMSPGEAEREIVDLLRGREVVLYCT